VLCLEIEMNTRAPTLGFDFGTTNSTVALADPGGAVRSVSFPLFGRGRPTARSILFFDPDEQEFAGHRPEPFAGNPAIERYEHVGGEGRLVLSPKSWLAARSFDATMVFGHRFDLEHLVGAVVAHMRARTREEFGVDARRVVAGRPVHFARGEGDEDDDFAEVRLRRAFAVAGIEDVTFEYEPIGAAYAYEQRLSDDELILIGDFGGGTSDFCLLAVGPSYRGASREERRDSILGTGGVGRAGDAFDARIIRNVVAPRLGQGSERRGVFGDRFPIPGWIYRHLEKWHRLSMLKAPDMMRRLHRIQRAAVESEQLEALLHIVEQDLGFALYRAVEGTKRRLSSRPEAKLLFHDGPVALDADVRRTDFEAWIGPELAEIEGAVDGLMESTRTTVEEVDRVFLTGGSSFVPAVRRVFEDRFGAHRIADGEELTSVARGLALRAAEAA